MNNTPLMESENLNIGDKSADLRVEIVDKDRLCYLVKTEARGAYGVRTIGKRLLQEFVEYFKVNPDKNANDARDALCGKSDLDRFEYGYAATLTRLAKMILNPQTECIRQEPIAVCLPVKSRYLRFPFQQIYYGAPGTGKVYEIEAITKKYDTVRTTFHPDSDYSTFVGAYKPTMEEADVQIVPVAVAGGITLDTNKGTYKEKRITYKFVKQAFLKAYLSAWKKYAEAEGEEVAPQFLVIEEINRGNCAQIFGDLFQLLDRQDNGFSSYPIEADADLQREIKEAFANDEEYKLPEGGLNLDGVVKGYDDLAERITNGEILLLPSNLYIWATMNTSDQSLFPIDSAFKRRWDWKYVKIANAGKGYKIKCGDEECDWWTFISKMNAKIAAETSSDDKKLGYFFCKPDDGDYISEERFVSKVMFYLWNDVFKDGDTKDFNVSGDEKAAATFEAFYNDDNTVNVANVRRFLVKIVGENNLFPFSDEGIEWEYDDEDGNTPSASSRNYDRYSVNGEGKWGKNLLAAACVEKYIKLHPGMSAKEVVDSWKSLGLGVAHFIESQEEYDARNDRYKDRVVAIPCGGETVYVAKTGYGGNGKDGELMNAVNQKDWGITVTKLD